MPVLKNSPLEVLCQNIEIPDPLDHRRPRLNAQLAEYRSEREKIFPDKRKRALARCRKIIWSGAVMLMLGLTACRPTLEESKGVQLVATEPLRENAVFEVRFDQPMVSAKEVGLTTTNSPLVVSPALDGTFTWVSSRSGVFMPKKSLGLDQEYVLGLRSGLTNANGTQIKAELKRKVRTPEFTATQLEADNQGSELETQPEVKVGFNAPVTIEAVSSFCTFENAAGKHIAAEVFAGTAEEMPYGFNATNFLVITPKEPLTIGNDWKLILKAGLMATENRLQLKHDVEMDLGDIKPFTADSGETSHWIGQTPQFRLKFSKSLPLTLTNDWTKWIVLLPKPDDLTVDVYGDELLFRGDFKSGEKYFMAVNAGLPSTEGFTLAEKATFTFDMPGISPRLYFPGFSEDQEVNGRRIFPLMTVNIPQIRVRAKLLSPENAVHALHGFKEYFRPWRRGQNEEEPYQRLNYDLLAGRTVFDETIHLACEQDETRTTEFGWNKILNGRKAGVIFLEASAPKNYDEPSLGTQALIQLTDIGMIWKTSAREATVFAFSQTTGEPIAGAAAQLLTDENEVASESVTDAAGIAHFGIVTNDIWIALRQGEDFHALEMKEHQMSIYSFGVPWAGQTEENEARQVMLFSDRDIYRPGETLYLKTLAREWTNGTLQSLAGLKAELKCLDPHGRKFFTTNIVLSARGSWSGAIQLPSTDRGLYEVTLEAMGCSGQHFFHMEDFQPSAFEISLLAKTNYSADEKIEIPLSAHYYFGKELSRAKVKWSVSSEPVEFASKAFEGFTFYDRRSPSKELHGNGSLTNGFVITPDISVTGAARNVSLLAEVTDLNQQTLTRRVDFVRQASDFYLGLRQTNAVVGTNELTPIEIAAVATDGMAWSGPVKTALKLERRTWDSILIRGAGHSARYRNTEVLTNIWERTMDLSGTGMIDFKADEPGEYVLTATATDAAGHLVKSAKEISVAATGRAGWNYRNEAQITLKAERDSYAPGETAKILVETPISGTAWVTVEREKVLRSFMVKLSGNGPMISVPIEAGDGPNIFVAVTLIRGTENSTHEIKKPEYRMGYCALTVAKPGGKLAVEIATSAGSFLPGQKAETSVMVHDDTGAAVPGAEVTLYAVDEGILDLSDYHIPDPAVIFYKQQNLAVRTGLSLPNLMTEDPEQLTFGNKGYLGGGGGQERLRKNFLACAFWRADLVTDAKGTATAAFTAPDSMTRYKIIAVAADTSAFGMGTTAFTVNKPLMVEPALPHFGCISDQISARAVVHNQTEHTGEVLVTLKLDDKAHTGEPLTDGGLVRRLNIPPHGSAAVDFPVELTDIGTAKWVWHAKFTDITLGDFTDAVESTLEIKPVAPMLREIVSAHVSGTETNLLATVNPQILEGHGTVTVNISNSRLNELNEAVVQLLHYPYGCVEQTGSSLLPWLVLRDLPVAKPWLAHSELDAATAVRSGVARLFTMQTSAGGLGYWPGAKEPMLWASAYGGFILAIAKHHGVEVPEESFDHLMKFLSDSLREPTTDANELADRCLALYALAMADRAEPAYHEKMFALRERLSTEDRSLLALAIAESHESKSMAEELLAPVKSPFKGAFGGNERWQAIQLMAWSRWHPESRTVDTLVTALMAERKEGHWWTTQGNAWAMLALTDYARRVEGNVVGEAEGTFDYDGVTYPFKTNSFAQELKLVPGRPLAMTATSGKIYVNVAVSARPPSIRQPRQDHGFAVQRTYQLLDETNQTHDVDTFQVGDRVLVTLHISAPEPAAYVAIDDPLPAILEAVNPEFKSQDARGAAVASDYYCDFREMRKDRVLFFRNDASDEDYVIRYLARARATGTVTAPGTKVEDMYRPEHYGLAETKTLHGINPEN